MNAWMTTQQTQLQQLWNERVLPWYGQLEEREQRILRIGAVLLPLIVLLFGVALPLQERHTQLQQELNSVQAEVAEADRLATWLSSHGKTGGQGSQEPALTAVERLAREKGVRKYMTSIKPIPSPGGTQRLTLSLKNAPYDASMRFISVLADAGLGINSLKLQAAQQSGYVHAQLVVAGN